MLTSQLILLYDVQIYFVNLLSLTLLQNTSLDDFMLESKSCELMYIGATSTNTLYFFLLCEFSSFI